ncbi:MAG TPA: hypothetical protein VMG38_10605 [Trebonia sp.]|nr:hypothetical protein [Trebonia sp.]
MIPGWLVAAIREAGRQLGYDDAQVSPVDGNRAPTESFARGLRPRLARARRLVP